MSEEQLIRFELQQPGSAVKHAFIGTREGHEWLIAWLSATNSCIANLSTSLQEMLDENDRLTKERCDAVG